MSGTIPDPDDLHTKAATLIEALPYFQRYAGRTFVVKYGGHAMGDEQAAREFASDVVLLKAVGINPVVVHGGGPQIGAMLKKLGVESTFVDGLRVTDKATAEIAEMVLSGAINKQLVGWIAQAGAKRSVCRARTAISSPRPSWNAPRRTRTAISNRRWTSASWASRPMSTPPSSTPRSRRV